ncbi:MAG: hypothetical protein FWD84_04190 [Oscillospiraceae bacterium]|nr:hypothetical protein [Oscillospiraceae bacterium]
MLGAVSASEITVNMYFPGLCLRREKLIRTTQRQEGNKLLYPGHRLIQRRIQLLACVLTPLGEHWGKSGRTPRFVVFVGLLLLKLPFVFTRLTGFVEFVEGDRSHHRKSL